MSVPDVSVVTPVFNAEDYIGDAVRSVLAQTIAPERLELIVVDDGSTDRSGEVVAELAHGDPRVKVIVQENSGTPGGARNPGIDAARGTFIFFLDADDILPEHSLERMVDVAIENSSDVVLGKLGSTDHRKVPSGMFTRTVLEADLVEDKVFNTLGPTKLIRRELIEGLQLRFPTDLTVGEDEPFMAAVYLNASTISVLSDAEYYLTRYRTDGANMTLAARDSASHAVVAMRVARVVETYTSPGERRDALLMRPFGRPLARALGARWLTVPTVEAERLAADLRSALGHLYTARIRASLPGETAAKLDLLIAGDLDGLSEFIRVMERAEKPKTTWEEGQFRRIVPEEIASLYPKDLRAIAPPGITGRLEDLDVEGPAVTVAVSCAIARFEGAADSLRLRICARGTDVYRDLETIRVDLSAASGSLFIRGRATDIPRGVWDLFAVVQFGDWEKQVRIGASRARSIEPEGASNVMQETPPEDRVIAYFTKGYGNLSIDSGAVLHKEFSRAHVDGLTLDENGRAVLLVRTSAAPVPGDEFFGHLKPTGRDDGRHLLPAIRLGERLVGLRLPLTPARIGATLSITSVLGGVPAPLPITGTTHWSDRAAGFGLEELEDGGVRVTPVRSSAVPPEPHDRRLGITDRVEQFITDSTRAAASSRLGARVKSLPVIGPASRSVARGLRRGRR